MGVAPYGRAAPEAESSPLGVHLVCVDSNCVSRLQDPGWKLKDRTPVRDVHKAPSIEVLQPVAKVGDLDVLVGLLA